MAAKAHTHKYILRNIGKRDKPRLVYACALPDCSHFMPTMEQVKGKESICWQCDKKMVMDNETIRKRRKKPRCINCIAISKGKIKKEEIDRLSSAVEDFFSVKGIISE